jgi:hypothetical protein
MVANTAGPIAGTDSIRRYAYTENFYWMQSQVTIEGIGSKTVYTSTNLYSQNINTSWDLMQGGDRSRVDRRINFIQGTDPLIGKTFGERTDSTKSTFVPWNTTSSQEYTFTTTRNNTGSQSWNGPNYQGPGLDTYAGVWQNRNLSTGFFNPYNNSGYLWNSGYTAFTNTWKQQSFVQLTTGPDRDGDSHSYFWVSATAVDLNTKQSIPVTSINVAGVPQSGRGRTLVYSKNNAGYREMLDTTPTAASHPSFSFDERTERAEKKAGVMAISTIAANSAWPGPRPAGMLTRMGYQGVDPSDDQILWDVLANSPMGTMMIEQVAPYFYPSLVAFASSIHPALATGVPSIFFGKPAGDLSQSTVADRKWLTLAFLSRSVNIPPPDVFSTNQVDLFGSGSKSSYRLLNELMVKNVVDGKVNKTSSIRRKRADVGTTRLYLYGPLHVKVSINGKWINYPIQSEWVNRTLFELFSHVPNTPGNDNGLITGGVDNTFTKHVTSAHAGWALEPVENMIVRGNRSDFFSRVILDCQNDTMVPEYELSADRSSINRTGKVWPTAYIYRWDPSVELYRKTIIEPQMATPFDGFMTIDK